MTRPDQYAVMGNPIAHSKSPRIHQLFAEQTGQSIDYRAILVARDRFPEAVAEFLASGGKGLNVTVPFKQQAWQLTEQLSDRARRAEAVNTLMAQETGILFGDNTDGAGLVRDLSGNLGVALAGKRILMLGAGGAARGVLGPLLDARPSALMIANRTPQRAERLVELFADLGNLRGGGFELLDGEAFDIVINATAAGLHGEVPPLPPGVIGPYTCCYDMVYGSEPTAFMQYARGEGAERAFDGLGMLVEQAAESFRLWRGVSPQTGPVIELLRGHRSPG